MYKPDNPNTQSLMSNIYLDLVARDVVFACGSIWRTGKYISEDKKPLAIILSGDQHKIM